MARRSGAPSLRNRPAAIQTTGRLGGARRRSWAPPSCGGRFSLRSLPGLQHYDNERGAFSWPNHHRRVPQQPLNPQRLAGVQPLGPGEQPHRRSRAGISMAPPMHGAVHCPGPAAPALFQLMAASCKATRDAKACATSARQLAPHQPPARKFLAVELAAKTPVPGSWGTAGL